MNFGDIVTAVLADAFDDSKRDQAKIWVLFRHAWLWDAQDWTFKYQTATITFPNGGQTVAGAPTDLQTVLAMYDANGDPVRGYPDRRRWLTRFNANQGVAAGPPCAYTMIGGQLLVDQGDGTQGLMLYKRAKPTLVEDGDETGLPDGYDLALVHGGKAEGFKLTNIPLAANFDADFSAAVTALENAYLAEVEETGEQFGAYRPGHN